MVPTYISSFLFLTLLPTSAPPNPTLVPGITVAHHVTRPHTVTAVDSVPVALTESLLADVQRLLEKLPEGMPDSVFPCQRDTNVPQSFTYESFRQFIDRTISTKEFTQRIAKFPRVQQAFQHANISPDKFVVFVKTAALTGLVRQMNTGQIQTPAPLTDVPAVITQNIEFIKAHQQAWDKLKAKLG